jgi:hypothetical protein
VNATERLLILCTLAKYDASEHEEASRLARETVDWELFRELAEVNATVPLVWKNLGALDVRDRIPLPLQERFQVHADFLPASPRATSPS